MRVLGVDPGLTRCGIGVVDGGAGQAPGMVDVTGVRSPPAQVSSTLSSQVRPAGVSTASSGAA